MVHTCSKMLKSCLLIGIWRLGSILWETALCADLCSRGPVGNAIPALSSLSPNTHLQQGCCELSCHVLAMLLANNVHLWSTVTRDFHPCQDRLSLSLSLDSGLSLFLSDTLPNTFQHNSACKLRADVSQTTEGRQQRTSHPQVPSITRPHHRGSRTWDDPSLCSLTRFTPVPSDMFYNLGPSYIVTNRGSICRFTC